jgi:hypothetical protein
MGLPYSWKPAVALLLVSLGVGILGGCTHEDRAEKPQPEPSAAAPLVRVRVTHVAGDLGRPQAERLATQLRGLVTDYVGTALVSDPPPGDRAFPGFTPRARRLAARDRDVLTLGSLGDSAEVTPRKVLAYLSVFAPRHRPAGATARLEVTLRVAGVPGTRTVRVSGRLLLTPTDAGWRVFGYDLASSAPGGGRA